MTQKVRTYCENICYFYDNHFSFHLFTEILKIKIIVIYVGVKLGVLF
jgi:hypothetical protein